MKSDFEERIKTITSPLQGSIPYTVNYKLSVKLKHEGLTLLELYTQAFPHIEKSIWLKKIEDGLLTLNEEKSSANQKLKAGWMTENKVHNKTEPYVSANIKLLYEDDQILVINKPSPLPMHPSGRFNKNTLTEILKLAYPQINFKIVHRLDANTTGVIVLAKTTQVANFISHQFQNNTIKKLYLALVEGIVKKDSQMIIEKISINKTKSGGRNISENGQISETKITVLKRDESSNLTLLKVEPKQGRTNQIRLHLASINHPIVGDKGYKNKSYFENNPLTYPKDTLFLHAYQLKIEYNSAEKQFIAKIPQKFHDKIEIN